LENEEVAELFRDEMINEIYHSSAGDELKDQLVQAVKDVEQVVLDTIKARK